MYINTLHNLEHIYIYHIPNKTQVSSEENYS
jgi:hypothetical protein